MIGEYDLDNSNLKGSIYLCKPNLNRTTIAPLTEVFGMDRKVSRGNINELNFSLPMYIIDTNKMRNVKNKHVDQLKERYIIRFEQGNEVEYYVIYKIVKDMSTSESVIVSCYSLGYQLGDKLFKYDYSEKPKNLGEYMYDVLGETNWSVGYIDAEFQLKYRSLNLDGTVLESVQQIAEKFVALIVWDTINYRISFYNPDNFGTYKGFQTKQGRLMKSVQQEMNTDEFCTRFQLYGKDGLSIQSINPLGTDFLQDFSYFLYPFSMDAQGNVIQSSDWFDDDVSIAIVNYDKLIDDNRTVYKGFLTDLDALYLQLSDRNRELAVLNAELIILQDSLATYNAVTKDSESNPNVSLINQISAKQNDINIKNNQISNVNSQIASKKNQIDNLNNLMKMENNFTRDQLTVLNNFIITKQLEDANYTNAKDLYEDGLKQFDKVREPKIVVQLSLVNFYEIVSERHNANKLSVGDIILVEHDILNIKTKAYVTEINFNYDSGDINVTVSNAKDLLTDKERFMKDVQKGVNSSNKLNMNEYKWDQAKAGNDDISQIINNAWDASKREIIAGNNNEVSISRRGVIIKDPANPLKMLIMQHGQLALTNDGGNTWKTAITAEGIVGETIAGKLLLGNKLIIQDNDGTFTIEGDLLTIKDSNKVAKVKLGQYEPGKYGLQIISKRGNVLLDENGIVQTYNTQLMDNVAEGYPLRFKFYVPQGMLSVREVQLNFSSERFRAYSTSTDSAGYAATTSTTDGGWGDTTSTDYINLTSTAQEYISGTSATSGTYTGTGGHNHGIIPGTRLAVYGTNNTVNGFVDWQPSGAHSHPIALGQHSHTISVPPHNHSFSIPSHNHTIYIPSHTHQIQYGIFESTSATGMNVYVNGVYRAGTFYGSENNVNLTPWISTSGWHSIEIHSQQLGRINASLYIQMFLGA